MPLNCWVNAESDEPSFFYSTTSTRASSYNPQVVKQ